MEVYANGKNIPSYSFGNLFTQGELFADKITFFVKRYYEGNDLLSCNFTMKGVTENNYQAVQTLYPENAGNDMISLEWRVADIFTANSGKLFLEITASKYQDGTAQTILKLTMNPVYVRPTLHGQNAPLPDTEDQFLAEIAQAVSEGLDEIQAKINSFDLTEVNERLDSMDDKCDEFLSRPAVIPVTQAEYDALEEKTDSLYVITGG